MYGDEMMGSEEEGQEQEMMGDEDSYGMEGSPGDGYDEVSTYAC